MNYKTIGAYLYLLRRYQAYEQTSRGREKA